MSDQDTPRDERRAERDAKRDMLDADMQDAYEQELHLIRVRHDARYGTTTSDEQETTED